MQGVERLATFIVDGQEKLENKNWALCSLAHLTMCYAKVESEHNEELEDTLVRVQLSK